MFKLWIDEAFLPSCKPLIEGVAEVVGPGAPKSDLAHCDAIIAPGNYTYDAAVFDMAPKLKVISRLGVGYERIIVPDATARNIVVCYAPEAPTISTAEHTLTLLFGVTKLLRPLDLAARKGDTAYAHSHLGMELSGRTLGLVGAGRIGSIVARVAAATGMRVLVFDPFVTPARAGEMGVELMPSLEALLGASDVVSLHVPVTPETRNMMNRERFAQMKPGSVFINAARGALVDETALTEALASGHLFGAGLDVFQIEPPNPDLPFLKFDNVLVTPHIASHTVAGLHRIWETALVQALQSLRGERPKHILNPEIWETRRR